MADITPKCIHNHSLAVVEAYNGMSFYGGVPLPIGWKDHPGCSFCDVFVKHITEKHALHPDNKPKHAQAADSDTWYTYTLTIPTGSTPVKDLTDIARNIMIYGLTNKPYEKASQYAYVLEHTEKGTPHVHGMYKTPSGRRIATKYFQRHHSIKEWVKTDDDKNFWNEKIKLGHGHRGGYHQKARSTESYEGYLEKEGVVIKSHPPV